MSRFRGLLAPASLACAWALVSACAGPRTTARAPDPAVPRAGPQTLVSGGHERTYIVHLPADAGPGPFPLVIALHGFGGSGMRFEQVTGFSRLADRERFVVAYPDGRFQRWNAAGADVEGSWRTDDVRFISELIDNLARRYPIDRGRVFVVGHSNGGFMTYRLARELSGKVRAVAVLAGSMYDTPYDEPTREVAVLHLHGLADTIIPFAGARAGPYRILPADSAVGYWIRKQHCAHTPDTVFDSAGIVGRRWRSRSGRGDVVLYTAAGMGHAWWTRARTGVDASELVWQFFRSVPPRGR